MTMESTRSHPTPRPRWRGADRGFHDGERGSGSVCGRVPHQNEGPADHRQAESDGPGELLVLCPQGWPLGLGQSRSALADEVCHRVDLLGGSRP